MEEDLKKVLASVGNLNQCVDEIETTLRNKHRGMIFTKETLALYGKANSPMVLKDQYKTLVRRAKLDKEIEKNVSKIVAWLKAQKPETGLDAQNLIIELVSSGDIEKFINTAPLKTLLYEQGKSSQDYDVILSIYLFEQIIPEVIED